MKVVSAPMLAHLSGGLTQLAVCLKMTRTDGVVIAATNHDSDLVILDTEDSPPAPLVYRARAGGTDSDVATSNALNTDTVDQTGVLSSDSITEEDLQAGLYDYAVIRLFVVNWSDLSMGAYSLRDGKVGTVRTERGQFTAELQGMMDALKRYIGLLCNPSCPYILGDFPFPAPYRGRCRVDLSGGSPDSPSIPYIVTGVLEGVSADGRTLYDSARTEPGPAAGVSITGITNSNPAVVTTAAPLGLPDQSTVTMSGILGPALLNTTAVIRNPSGNQFELFTDTSDTGVYPPYSGGGIVTPLGGDSGWFDYGLFTVTGDDSPPSRNANRSMEVKSYAPGQWTLQSDMPFPLLGNESYELIVGCNKTPQACKGKFDNFDNFGGFPFVPGQDKTIQVAQPQSGQGSDSKK